MVVSDTQKQILKLRKEIKKCACEKKEKQLKSLIEKNKKELAEKKKPKVVIKGKAKLTKEQKEKLKAKKGLTEVEKNRCMKAVNNANSVIRLYEKQGGDIKNSDFSNKKDLMETITDLKKMKPQLKLCSKTEQDIVDKALSLHSKGISKKEPTKEEPTKDEKGNTFQDKEKEIKELFTKALSPELKKAYQSKDTNKMKKEYKKAVNILAEYLGKTGFATNVSQARRTINGGSVGRLIKSFGEGKKLKEPYIFRKVDLSDVYNRLNLTKKEPTKEEPTKDDPKKVWNTIKDLNWKGNVRSKILALFGEGRMGFKNYYIIKSSEIKGNKFIIKYVNTPYRAKMETTDGMALEDKKENEKKYIELTTKPQTSKFTIPKN
tara:strand:+ start:311 stop:1438 length:1128 start_codon:yes stop_codon:yes gene_type:complete